MAISKSDKTNILYTFRDNQIACQTSPIKASLTNPI